MRGTEGQNPQQKACQVRQEARRRAAGSPEASDSSTGRRRSYRILDESYLKAIIAHKCTASGASEGSSSGVREHREELNAPARDSA